MEHVQPVESWTMPACSLWHWLAMGLRFPAIWHWRPSPQHELTGRSIEGSSPLGTTALNSERRATAADAFRSMSEKLAHHKL